MLASLHLLCGVSLARCNFFLAGTILSIRICLARYHEVDQAGSSTGLSGIDRDIVFTAPRDVRKIIAQLDLEPDTHKYLMCPTCYKLYKYGSEHELPLSCTDAKIPNGQICDTPLFRKKSVFGQMRFVPVRTFLYHDMKQWFGRMLCRPGMEQVMDEYPNKLKPQLRNGELRDIWDANALRHFTFSDGEGFYPRNLEKPESRYAFSLCMDSYNPYQSKAAGKQVSATAMYMACLNLPPLLRYRPENIYLVGIIPGPGKPSIDEINHVLSPLVGDLLLFYDPGVFYSQTPNHREGLLVRCALIPLVCDLPAARQMGGFSGHSADKFCSICLLSKKQINSLEPDKWECRTARTHRQFALAWKEATSKQAREDIFDKQGLRWSALLDLPYWDPVKFTTIDSMHGLFLGNLKRHCRRFWGMSAKAADSDGAAPEHADETVVDSQAIIAGYLILRSGKADDIRGLHHTVMKHLCIDLKLLPPPPAKPTKKTCYKALMQYVRSQFSTVASSHWSSAN